MKNHSSRWKVAAIALAAATTLSACSGPASSEPAAENTEQGPVAVTIAEYPVLSNAASYIALNEGIYAEHNLDATLETITNGADTIPRLLSGDLTFAPVDIPTAIQAAKENVGVVAVTTMNVGVDVEAGYAGVVAPAASGYSGWKDLEGKKVAVNQIGGSAAVQIAASMEMDGADASGVQWVELGQPETIPALLAGQVDAAMLAQPLLTAAEAEGMVQVGNPEQLTVPNIPTFVYLATKEFVETNADAVKAFQAAYQEASAIANSDHDLVIETAKTSTSVDPALLAKITGFPRWGENPLVAADIEKYMEVMKTAGLSDTSALPKGSDVVSSLND